MIEYQTLAHLPIAHIASIFGYLIAPFYSAGAVYCMRKLEWKAFPRYIKELKITALYTVPSIYLRIAKSPNITDLLETLEAAVTGTALMDVELQMAANAKLGEGKNILARHGVWGRQQG